MSSLSDAALSSLNFKPVGDFILIEPLKKNTTRGGIALPDGVDPDPARGVVVAVGPGRETETGHKPEMGVSVGDTVYLVFVYQQPIQISLAGKEYVLVRSRDIVGLAA